MKVNEILKETPLPPDWNKSVYKGKGNFADRIAYAKERADKIGSGSARVAFEIEYEGRPTILKIAKNKKGLAQNEYEAEILNDGYIQMTDLFIPIIDFDTENPQPLWIHTEKAKPITLDEFKKHFDGLSPYDVANAIAYKLQKLDPNNPDRSNTEHSVAYGEEHEPFFDENEKLEDLLSVFMSYGNMMYTDIPALDNWGLYEGEPVIVDIGLSTEVFKLHYNKRYNRR